MAVKKKSVTKKASKKVTKKQVGASRPEEPRLTIREMRDLEELSSDFTNSTTMLKLKDQYLLNLSLKKENLQAEIKLLEHEEMRQRELQKAERERRDRISEKLQKMGNDLKSKYSIKSSGSIKYDTMSGKIIDK